MRRLRAIVVTATCTLGVVGVSSTPVIHAVGGTISGVVTDTSGSPIVGATVRATGDEFGFVRSAAVTTDAGGAFVISGLAANTQPWRVAAGAVGFVPTYAGAYGFRDSQTFPVTADETFVVNFQLSRPTASISGTITSPGGAPVDAAIVHVDSSAFPFFADVTPAFDTTPFHKAATTDPAGRYSIVGLAPGNVFINAESPSRQFVPTYLGQVDQPPIPFAVQEGQAATAVDIELTPAATIKGHVTDGSGNSVRGATVIGSAFPFPEQAVTDIDGNYEITHLHPGLVDVFAFGPPATSFLMTDHNNQAGVTVTAGQVLAGIDIALTPAARINTTFLNSDGTPSSNHFGPIAACPSPALPVPTGNGVSGPTIGCDDGQSGAVLNFDKYILVPTGAINLGVLGSSVIALDLARDDILDCTIVYGGSTTCTPGTPLPPDDGDTVPRAVEDAAPGLGDGNADGVLDSVQSNVASLPVAVGSGYLTASIANPGLITSLSVSSQLGGSLASDVGQIVTTILPAHYGDTVDIVLRKESPWNANSLLIGFFVRPANRLPASLATFNGSTLTLHITDGGVGDEDTARNGSITVFATPVISAIADTTPPTVVCPSPPSFLLNQPNATLSASVNDDASGVAAPSASVNVSTSVVGTHTAVVTASDIAGNVREADCSYSVGVKLDRLISPSPRQTSATKAGRTIAVRWRALDYNGAAVIDPNHFVGVTFTVASCHRGEAEHIDSVRNRGLRYLGNGRWEYDVAVPDVKGCYSLELGLVGTSRQASLRVR